MATKFSAVTNSDAPIGKIISSVRTDITGWIVCDGKTIGDVGSGADFEGDLYRKLWDFIHGMAGCVPDVAAGKPFRLTDAAIKGTSSADWGAGRLIAIDFATDSLFFRQFGTTHGPPNLGESEGDGNKSHNHGKGTISAADTDLTHNHSYDRTRLNSSGQDAFKEGSLTIYSNINDTTTDALGDHTHTISGSTANDGDSENRPKNVALNYFIKY